MLGASRRCGLKLDFVSPSERNVQAKIMSAGQKKVRDCYSYVDGGIGSARVEAIDCSVLAVSSGSAGGKASEGQIRAECSSECVVED
jgi:hypothetical protein